MGWDGMVTDADRKKKKKCRSYTSISYCTRATAIDCCVLKLTNFWRGSLGHRRSQSQPAEHLHDVVRQSLVLRPAQRALHTESRIMPYTQGRLGRYVCFRVASHRIVSYRVDRIASCRKAAARKTIQQNSQVSTGIYKLLVFHTILPQTKLPVSTFLFCDQPTHDGEPNFYRKPCRPWRRQTQQLDG